MLSNASGHPQILPMIKTASRCVLGIGAVIMLVGCVTSPARHSTSELLAEPLVPIQATSWIIQGKIKVTLEGDHQNISFNWHRRSSLEDALRLSGPAGFGGLTIRRYSETVTWVDGATEQPLDELPVSAAFRGFLVEIPITDLAATLLGYDVASTKWASEVVDWQLLSGYRLPRAMVWSLEGASARVVLTQLSFPEPGSG